MRSHTSHCIAWDLNLYVYLEDIEEGMYDPASLLLAAYYSLVAQMVKNQPAMWETWVQSLSREDPM